MASKDTLSKDQTPEKRKTKSVKKGAKKGFVIPQLISETQSRGLKQVLTSSEHFNMLAAFEANVVNTSATVPVGHLWHLGPVVGDKVFACYRNASDGCDWVEVPNNNIPKTKPK